MRYIAAAFSIPASSPEAFAPRTGGRAASAPLAAVPHCGRVLVCGGEWVELGCCWRRHAKGWRAIRIHSLPCQMDGDCIGPRHAIGAVMARMTRRRQAKQRTVGPRAEMGLRALGLVLAAADTG